MYSGLFITMLFLRLKGFCQAFLTKRAFLSQDFLTKPSDAQAVLQNAHRHCASWFFYYAEKEKKEETFCSVSY
jgi:hypothetical protein